MLRNRPVHIAMVGIPAVSHILPSLEVLRELVRRGHRVTYVNDPRAERVEELVTGIGAELVPYRSRLPMDDHAWPEDPISAMDLFLEDSIHCLDQVRAFHEEHVPDLYVSDIGGMAAQLLGEAQDVPHVQLSPSMVGWEGWEDEVAGPLAQLPGGAEYYAKGDRWLAENGAVTTRFSTFISRPRRSVALILEAMQQHADRVDHSRYSFVGPAFGDRGDQGQWQRPAGVENVLLVSLGSAYTHLPEFYRQCLVGFGDLPGWHVVLQIGKHTDLAELGTIPANVEVHRWVPQLEILRQADAFVTHAGMGGCNEGLSCGVPMIAVPQDVDQPMNADALVRLGVARRIDTEEANGAALRSALLELTADPEVARRSKELQEQARAAGGTQRAADLIEAELRPVTVAT